MDAHPQLFDFIALARSLSLVDEATLRDCVRIRRERIDKFYEEAARRLPLEEMPELDGCICAGGLCIGLGDPVTNIILNTIGLLHHDQQEQEDLPPPQRDFRVRRGAQGWEDMAFRSLRGLRSFMTSYFRYLSHTEAARYLYVASQDLPLALALLEHVRGLRKTEPQRVPLLPDGGKLKSAFRIAAIQAEHPMPDVLAQLMTARYPSDLLSRVMDKLQHGTKQLTAHDVREIRQLLSHQWPPTVSPVNIDFWCRPEVTPTCTLSDDGMVQITTCIGEECRLAKISVATRHDCLPSDDLRYICPYTSRHMEDNLAFYRPQFTGELCAWLCRETASIKMCVLDTIIALYIRVMSIVPCPPCFLRALLLSGHCYGPMDPMSNVIINATWHAINFPPTLDTEDRLPQGILDTKAISRLASRTLDGLLTLTQGILGRECSEHSALLLLMHHDCNLTPWHQGFNPHLFPAAAKASKHPQHVAFGLFLVTLSNNAMWLKEICPGFAGDQWISCISMNHLLAYLHNELPVQTEQMGTDARCPSLSPTASNRVSEKKLDVHHKLAFVHRELKKLLRNYCYQHPWEPTYHVDIVCGVWASNSPNRPNVYHANFLAGTPVDAPRKLFFAEFWLSPLPLPSNVSLKTSLCCPIYDSLGVYSVGRCSFCEGGGSKIMHPPSGHSGIIEGLNDSYPCDVYEVGSEKLLESDLVYFDHDADIDLFKAIEGCSGYEDNKIPMSYQLDRHKPSSFAWEWSSSNPFRRFPKVPKH